MKTVAAYACIRIERSPQPADLFRTGSRDNEERLGRGSTRRWFTAWTFGRAKRFAKV